jgi:hypothetical protein
LISQIEATMPQLSGLVKNAPDTTAKRAMRPLTTIDLAALQGPVVTPVQIAGATGMSHRFVLEDIKLGNLKATNVGRGKRPVYRIPFHEAQRYARKLGAI